MSYSFDSHLGTFPGGADVAQLVEHHLAKVRVAGSNPVVRSEVPIGRQVPRPGGVAEWHRQGPAKPLYAGSIPASASHVQQVHVGRLAQWESTTLTR